jgi:hypothetical protein
MQGLFTDVDAIVIDVLHDLQHVQQGECGLLIFEKLNPATNAPEEDFTIDSFEYDDRSANDRALPPDVQFEVRISEGVLRPDELDGVVSIQHETPQGTIRFAIVKPSPFWPSGLDRFWRIWLAVAEVEKA